MVDEQLTRGEIDVEECNPATTAVPRQRRHFSPWKSP
jgi:hypothetical protein